MKKIALIVLLIAFSFPVFADPPNAIHASYDKSRAELNVTVQHIVADRTTHFVNEVDIYKNGREVDVERFSFQTSHRNQTMPPIKIAAYVGDIFKIVAKCKNGGSKEITFTVK
ncbi:MAG: hypothetical protein HN337_08610 [Deltaproteobacteria bacterium]|jgi:hypothetical protein|nr:hypothetical protein [Deltaproteobacteria bacterium]